VNKPVITALEPGRVIAWARTEPFGGTVEWSYRFEPAGDGIHQTLQRIKQVVEAGESSHSSH
jgi:hypothetical protein